jgi:hypothetical protein
MAMSLDPSILQQEVNRSILIKYGYKKKQSAGNTPVGDQQI